MSGTPGTLSLSASWPSAARSPTAASSSTNGSNESRKGRCSYSERQKLLTASSCASFGSIQLVLRLASRSAFSRYTFIRSASIAHVRARHRRGPRRRLVDEVLLRGIGRSAAAQRLVHREPPARDVRPAIGHR